MKRKYPEQPLVGVGGIVFLEDKVLLIKRKNPPGEGEWNIPGGLVKVGETLEQAIVREVEEETGIKISKEGLVEVVERIFPDNAGKIRYHYVIIDFLCHFLKGKAQPQSDALAVQWQPIETLDDLNINAELKKVIKKAYLLWQKR
ncbi:MAG: GDP-mannose mannosyl hydrolase [Candidatus Methanoperedenaceae archaeon GB50]|uniref:NUDIX domain-containing protein n=1 Tax=Desulfofervidus auxilii TaxID=1621989 RepID=A0A7V1I4U4_DESA2|nr:MAG: GDP-mannose mannosyl hydrolase [Candidatus Methanoperedenaceae archaeon GB50]CAD7775863.1 MAG: GDP-mannose mannosyl hydrolase [Candidatus Methanoperedenaceae archaeon GB37]HEB74470.1 NUDIX domain-containing protein [Candidatus Desulfofervidus auxilii]